MLGEQFFAFTIGMVDTYLAGRISKDATAAVGTAAYMGWFFSMVLQLLAVGSGALVARMFGERRVDVADKALNQSFLSAIVLGIALMAGIGLMAPLIADSLSQTAAARDMCTIYLRIDAMGYAMASITFVGAAVLRGSGDTRTPMAVMIIVNIINVIVSFALVYVWKMGVVGIVVGTLVARVVGGLLMIRVLIAGRRGMRLHWSGLRPDFGIIWRMGRIGLPSFVEAMIMWFAHYFFLLIILRTAVGEAATVNFAAHLIAIRLEAITYLPAVAWMTASATMIGQYLGAGRADLAQRSGHMAAAQGGLLTCGVMLVFFLFAGPIWTAMTADPLVREVGVPPFKVLAFMQPFIAVMIIYVGSLRGAGDTRWPMMISFITSVFVRLPAAYVGGVLLGGGLLGAWSGMFADNILRCILMFLRYSHGGWQRVRV
jgi:putative MATE family efflux protein